MKDQRQEAQPSGESCSALQGLKDKPGESTKKIISGTSRWPSGPAVRHSTSTTGDMDLIPGWRTKILYPTWIPHPTYVLCGHK